MGNEHPTYEQQKSYYDTKWLSWINRRTGADDICRREFIISSARNLIKAKPRPKIIDLGCGSGWLTKALSKYGQVVGVDLSTAVAQKKYPGLTFIQVNVVTDNIEGRYDIVVSADVIEHLSSEDQEIYVKKAYDLLNEPGYMILTMPNKPKAESLVKALSISRERLQPIENWLDIESLRVLLLPYFEITYAGTTVFNPALIRKRRYLHYAYIFAYIYLGLYKPINRILRTSQRGLYLTVVARKRPGA